MATIFIKAFMGERPRIDPRHLPNEAAQIASGCHFYHGNLSALRKPKLTGETVLFNAKTIFKYLNIYWFAWSKKINAVNSQVANDPWQRVYFTGDGYPKVTNNIIFSGVNMPAASYRLGVQAPENVITGIITEGILLPNEVVNANDDETRYYTHTFVTEQGEEGAPGNASVKMTILTPSKADTLVTLSFLPPNVNQSNITNRRIYRTATGGGSADYLLVAEIPIAQATFVDNLQGDELGAPLETYDYEMPLIDMKGLVAMANGIMAGYSGNTVCFSESYLSYAWPSKYQMTTEHNIVTMVAMGNSLAVLTEGYPYIFSGTTPDSIAGHKIESNQSCSNDRSAVIIEGALIYASPDGLVQLTVNGAISITDKIITREQWQAYQPSTIEAYYQEGRYLAFYGVALNKGFIFDPKTGDFRNFDSTAYCGFNSLIDDALYLSNSGNISKWEDDILTMDYVWRSKVFQFSDSNLSSALVKGDNLALSGIRFLVDGIEAFNLSIGSIPVNAFRLPETRGNTWEIEVYGKAEIKEIIVTDTMDKIRRITNG